MTEVNKWSLAETEEAFELLRGAIQDSLDDRAAAAAHSG
jgi:hypothetical protein